jgi:hypothetical protein
MGALGAPLNIGIWLRDFSGLGKILSPLPPKLYLLLPHDRFKGYDLNFGHQRLYVSMF